MGQIKDSYQCSLVLTHDLMGGKWKLRVLWHIINGDNRLSLLQKNIEGITHKVLIQQLRELEECGIVDRVDYDEMPKRVEYSISDKYKEIIPIIDHICSFTKSYASRNNITVKD